MIEALICLLFYLLFILIDFAYEIKEKKRQMGNVDHLINDALTGKRTPSN